MHPLLIRFLPDMAAVSGRERLRSGLGAGVGILLTGLLGSLSAAIDPSLPTLVAPMGASAVLLFAVPSSPLAQPWSIIGGNMLAAAVGMTAVMLIPNVYVAGAVAVGAAIYLMMLLRCLHPPSGAIALTAVLGGPGLHALGYGFVLWPVAGNSLCLLLAALAYNRLVGRTYPHRPRPVTPDQTAGTAASPVGRGFHADDLDAVLKDYDRVLDIDRDDLETILRRTELHAFARRSSATRCGDLMLRGIPAVAPDMPLRALHGLLASEVFGTLPVTNDRAEVIGIVTEGDLLNRADWSRGKPEIGIRQRLRLIQDGASAPNGTVKDVMSATVPSLGIDMPISAAAALFAETGFNALPVTRANGKLSGMVRQADVLNAVLADAAREG
ncbi:HPP family protein [Rhizobium halophytocola]|nr:HPP family protein [Rhizobium halophytocola]